MIDAPLLNKERLELTKDYAKEHYGTETYHLYQPQMIVIHYTVTDTLSKTLATFKPNIVPLARKKLVPYGDVNVSTHFVIDKDGTIYALLPTTIMARHTIGFNHTAIGIENVARNATTLTIKQLESNIRLIYWLTTRHPSIGYLIGHHEYMQKEKPHFVLYKAKNKAYTPLIKIDPGWSFMQGIRKGLKETYQLTLKD